MRWGAARDIFERIASWSDRHSPQTLFARALIIDLAATHVVDAQAAHGCGNPW